MHHILPIAAGSLGYFWGSSPVWFAVTDRAMLLNNSRDRKAIG